ncbi:mechanosensitive ion channel family protein [Tenacibaculum sp. UWU-22]|uniref:mechanosensitive ion channel family protein n=1 Tax=Tenacibaculum sp. UWU-22 TaxID=3234187 RepID=UPI0034DB35E3
MKEYISTYKELVIDYFPKIIMALVILIVGLYFINLISRTIKKLMQKRGLDVTLQSFLGSLINWTLKILLFVSVISKLGIPTTSFATIIGAAGLAIGLALQGSLSNFAGGTLIIIFKPFKVGDYIEAQGIKGIVKRIDIFTTKVSTPENRLAILPNGALSNGNIINYSTEGKLRVDLTFGVSYHADIKQTKEILLNVLSSNAKVLKNPAPTVMVCELADSSVNFAVRPWCKTDNYWDVYFETTENVKLALDKAGIEIPYPHSVEIQKKG